MPFRMQLALQGGGAKIVDLIAVLEAIEDLETRNIVKVTRIAGASAGAIAGALFAARVPMVQVREKLKALRHKFCSFPHPGKALAAWSIWRGVPMASTAVIEKALEDLFKERNVSKVGDLKVNTLIVSADLYKGTTHIADDQEFLVDALLDSSAIPIYFRLWSSDRGGLVDGGICENLPLPPTANDLGPVIGVSFQNERPGSLKGAGPYVQALLNTAIQNSVERARKDLGPKSVIPITSRWNTFDFAGALSDEGGLGADYLLTQSRAKDWLEKYVKSETDASEAPADLDLWDSQNVEIMRRLGEIYVKQHESKKYNVRRVTFHVTAYCLLKAAEPTGRVSDLVQYEVVFETLDEPVFCQSMALTIAEDSTWRGMATVRIKGRSGGATITPTLVPVIRPREEQRLAGVPADPAKAQLREMVVYFDPVLPPRSGPYTLTLEEWIDNVMSPLAKQGEDRIFVGPQPRAAKTIDRTDLVLHVPKTYGSVRVRSLYGPSNEAFAMPDELSDKYVVPGGLFNTVGWTCANADPSKPIAIELHRM